MIIDYALLWLSKNSIIKNNITFVANDVEVFNMTIILYSDIAR